VYFVQLRIAVFRIYRETLSRFRAPLQVAVHQPCWHSCHNE
jgi:hypothetical protein